MTNFKEEVKKMIINHNIPALNAYFALQGNSNQVSNSLQKLSSGLRINKAADDAAGLAISEKMRSQIRGLDQASRNAQDGISMIQTAEGALSETHSILQRMRELSVQAANDTYTSSDRANIQTEINQLTSEVNRIAGTTQFNGKSLLDGSTSAVVSSDKLTTKVFMRDGLRVLDQFGQKAPGGGNYKLEITATAGVNQVQKTDIFRVKHAGTTTTCIDSLSGVTCFTTTNAPSGTYNIETVDIATSGDQATKNSGVNLALASDLCGSACNITLQVCAMCSGSYFNDLCFVFSTSNAATGVCINGNVVTFNRGTASADTYATTVTCWATCLAGTTAGHLCQLCLSVCATAAGLLCTSTQAGYSGCQAYMASATTQGADIFGAKAAVQGEFQQNKSAGSGLVKNICMETATQRYNSSMVFEVTAVDTNCNKITVSVKYDEYDKFGCLASGTVQSLTLMTNCTVQGSDITIGNVTFDSGGFLLSDKDHFSAGDKFAVDVTSTATQYADKLTIRDSNSVTKEFTFNNCYLNERQLCINTFYLDTSNGNVTEATFKTCFGTFAQIPSVNNISVGTTNLLSPAGCLFVNDVKPATNYSLTVSVGGSCSGLQLEKLYSQSGKATVSAGDSGVTAYNASMLFTVEDIDGNTMRLRVQGYATAEASGGACLQFDCMICIQAGGTCDIQSVSATAFGACVMVTLGAASDFRVGDKFTMFKTAGTTAGGTNATIDLTSYQRDVSDTTNLYGGSEITGTRLNRKLSVDTTMSCLLTFSTFELDSTTGASFQSKIVFDKTCNSIAAGTMTFQTSAQDAVYLDKGLNVGDIAKGSTKLYDLEKFWDASGNFILETPQTLQMIQGDGSKTTINLSREDTIDSVTAKLNAAIGTGLGQTAVVGASNADKFASYVYKADANGLETVKGTFVIRSAIAGDQGKISFVGDDATINALSLVNIQAAKGNTFSVNVNEAHQGTCIASNVVLGDNNLVGVVHQNVDVQFAANTGVRVTWDDNKKDFTLTGGAGYKEDTFVHMADRTTVIQIGANQKQDIGFGIGNMGASALGIDTLQVTSNELATQAIGKIDTAIARVSSQRSTLGALQNRLDHTINNLSVSYENLTAAESRIRDVDMAKQMMEFTKYNILNQAATAMLAQANQLPQQVLQLLR